MADEHSTPIQNPKQLIIVVALAFVIPIVVILLLTQLVTGGEVGTAGDPKKVLERIRPVGEIVLASAIDGKTPPAIAPVAATKPAPVATAQPAPPAAAQPAPVAAAVQPPVAAGKPAPVTATAPAPAVVASAAPALAGMPDAKKTYESACVVCHGAGVAGAPRLGDKAAWTPRLKTGIDSLYAAALKGKGAMPAKGGFTTLPDADIKAAVDLMVAAVK